MNECEMYISGMSITQVSDKTGIPKSTLRFRFKRKGILRSRDEAMQIAAAMGRLGSGLRGKKRPPRDSDWNKKISEAKMGVGVGTSLKPNGYLEITMGENKGKAQHVVVMENEIGRTLNAGECVHHINGNKIDNRIENLLLMTRSEHAALHAKENNQFRNRSKDGRYK